MSDGISIFDVIKRGGFEASLITTFNATLPFYEEGGCKNFCVNGYLAGNCRAPRSEDDRSKESCTERIAGQPAG